MLHASTQKLIDKLCDMTANRQIDWREGDEGRSVFETEGYVVEVGSDPSEIRLLQEGGRELEKADAALLAATPADDGGTYEMLVTQMAVEAHRIAIGAEAAISSILTSLDSPKPVISSPKASIAPQPDPAPAAAEEIAPTAPESGDEAPALSNQGGHASEAAMAAAVADMAEKINSEDGPSSPPNLGATVEADFSSPPQPTAPDITRPPPSSWAPAEDITAPAAPTSSNAATDGSMNERGGAETPSARTAPGAKVTSTGLAIGAGVGSFVQGVPEDVERAAALREETPSSTDAADTASDTGSDEETSAKPDPTYSPWS